MASLRHYRLCPHSRAARILLAEAGIICELIDDKPWEWAPDRLALDPAGELPVLSGPHGLVVGGIYPISEWVADSAFDERAGERDVTRRAHAFSGSASERAEIRRLAAWFTGKMDREVTRLLLEERIYARFRASVADQATGPDPEVLRVAAANMSEHLRYLEHLTSGRKWLAGDVLTFADMAAAAQLSVVDYLGGIDWSGHDATKEWYARLKSRPSVRAILTQRVPGAPNPPAHYDDPDF
ncbi:MAG: glutathione S-transferase family protein [Pseudomonadota bacterium]